MRQVNTRELLHHSKRIQAALARGESFEWTSRGKVIATIRPVAGSLESRHAHDWLHRARSAGAELPQAKSLAEQIYRDRDQG